MDTRAREAPPSVPGLRTPTEDSEAVGDGGVKASEVADETDLAGGVVIVGEEEVVTGECWVPSLFCVLATDDELK
jgi:hypothetical protein